MREVETHRRCAIHKMSMLSSLASLLLVQACVAFSPGSAARMGAVAVRPRAATLVAEESTVESPPPAEGDARDPDWLAPFSDVELAEQEAKLTALSEKWKKFEDLRDFETSKRSGFGPSPEVINGRTAMFFIIVGLVTEYYTGQNMPQQVTTMLQTLAIIE